MTADNEILLQVRNLKTHFMTKRGWLKAVDGVSYDIPRGKMVALVGESACGKSVSAYSLIRLIPEPPGKILDGEVIYEGRDLLKLKPEEMRHVRGKRIAVVFQEPMTSLNPVFNIRTQMSEGMLEHKVIQKKMVDKECMRLLDIVGITDTEDRLTQYPGEFSGGMRQRVMLGIAVSSLPGLIIADEPTTAVDVTIQAQLLELMQSLKENQGVAILLITHNLGMVAKYADSVNVMYAGRIVEQADADEFFENPRHPYSWSLLECVPRLDRGRGQRLDPIQGQPPDLVDRPPGCAFHPRCKFCVPSCKEEWPSLKEIAPGHLVACTEWEKVA